MPKLSPQDETLLTRTAEIVFAGLNGDAPLHQLPGPRQVFAIIYSAQGVIDNGGFQFLFESDWPENPPYNTFSEAYREIGATEVADLLDRAAALFPFGSPHLDREARRRFLRASCVESGSPMGILSGNAINASGTVFHRLAEYVRAHKSEYAED